MKQTKESNRCLNCNHTIYSHLLDNCIILCSVAECKCDKYIPHHSLAKREQIPDKRRVNQSVSLPMLATECNGKQDKYSSQEGNDIPTQAKNRKGDKVKKDDGLPPKHHLGSTKHNGGRQSDGVSPSHADNQLNSSRNLPENILKQEPLEWLRAKKQFSADEITRLAHNGLLDKNKQFLDLDILKKEINNLTLVKKMRKGVVFSVNKADEITIQKKDFDELCILLNNLVN